MAIHTFTAPARAGERTRSPKSQIGPVTQALRVMLAADPNQPRIRELRRSIADRIEADLALLDALDGDADFEHDAGETPEQDDDFERDDRSLPTVAEYDAISRGFGR